MQHLRIFASGENLFTITSLIDFFDPESIEGGSWGHGNVYPLSRTFSFWIKCHILKTGYYEKTYDINLIERSALFDKLQ